MTENYFNNNLDTFIDVYKEILNTCIEFDDKVVKDDPVYPLTTIAKEFSDLDKQYTACAHKVKIEENGELRRAFITITPQGKVDYIR